MAAGYSVFIHSLTQSHTIIVIVGWLVGWLLVMDGSVVLLFLVWFGLRTNEFSQQPTAMHGGICGSSRVKIFVCRSSYSYNGVVIRE